MGKDQKPKLVQATLPYARPKDRDLTQTKIPFTYVWPEQTTITPTTTSMSNEACRIYSGGAIGADYAFSYSVAGYGKHVNVLSFGGHKLELAGISRNMIIVTNVTNIIIQGVLDKNLETANGSLKRKIPNGYYIRNLLRRDAAIGSKVDAICAISDFEKGEDSKLTHTDTSVGITGGTAWACQVFFDKQTNTGATVEQPLLLFLFSQKTNTWWQCYKNYETSLATWKRIEKPVVPQVDIALIGSRDLRQPGRVAIDNFVREFCQ